MKKVLDVKDLCVTYSNKERSVYAVQNVSFSLNEGDSIGIVGESGSGKSTLVMALLRLLSEQTAKVSGECYLNGKELLSLFLLSRYVKCVGQRWLSSFRRR